MLFYEDILRAFQKSRVRYVLVGGMAVNLLGLMRSTSDMDILVDMTDSNLKKIVTILTDRGYKIKQPVNPMGIADAQIRREWIASRHLKALNFYKEQSYEEVDIIIESPVTFELAHKNAIIVAVDGLRLPVISPDHLIKMKKTAGRAVDQMDIEELKKLKRSLANG